MTKLKRKTYIQNLTDERIKWESEVKDLDEEIAELEREIETAKI